MIEPDEEWLEWRARHPHGSNQCRASGWLAARTVRASTPQNKALMGYTCKYGMKDMAIKTANPQLPTVWRARSAM